MPAGGTRLWPSGAAIFMPFIIAIFTYEKTIRAIDFVIAAFNADGLAVDQGIRNRFPRLFNNPSESGPRHAHHSAAILMGQALQIRKP